MPATNTAGYTRLAVTFALTLSIFGCRDSLGPNTRKPGLARIPVAPALNHSFDQRRIIPDEYIVVFDESVRDVPGRAAALASVAQASVKFTYNSAVKGFSARMSSGAAAALAQHPGVDFVEPDQIVSTLESSYAAAWGIDRIDQASLPLNGQYTFSSTGAGVRAYIIDTGIRRTHAQFGGRVAAGFSAIADGYGPDGCNGHGTHVAGTLGGSTVGVAKGATLVSVRVLDCSGSGTLSGVIAGVDWVTANRVLPAVANMSLTSEVSPALNAAIENSIASGVVYAVAAGNSASDACGYSPSSAANAISVAATTGADVQASYSNSGGCVDIYAPGSTIHSAWNTDDNAMIGLSGTSMAAPHVAGAAALYLQSNPSATPDQVWQSIRTSATTNALAGVPSGTPNLLLRVNGSSEGVVIEPPASPSDPVPTNSAPAASFTTSCPSQKNNCTFDASASRDDKGIVRFSWSFGDGATSISAATPIVSHTYRAKGKYTATLTVSDEGGLTSTVQRTVSVKSVLRN